MNYDQMITFLGTGFRGSFHGQFIATFTRQVRKNPILVVIG